MSAALLHAFPLGYQMNETVHKFLSAGDKSMPKMYLNQPEFTYNAWGSFTKNKERILKIKETEYTN